MMTAMGVIWLLTVTALLLAIAALIKIFALGAKLILAVPG